MAISVPVITQGDGLNSPALNIDSGNPQPRVRALKDAGQAAEVAIALQRENHDRNLHNARIAAKNNSERPFRRDDLEEHGLGWKSNFPTKPLGTLSGKASARLSNVVHALRYFTSAKLPETYADANKKTEAFRREITTTIRAWPQWIDLIDDVALENTLFGFTSVACLDKYSWKPDHYRQDSFFAPRTTKHTADTASVIVFKELYKPYDLFELISDRTAAEAAGWNVKNTLVAINEAIPDAMRSSFSDMERVYQDLMREVNLATSFTGCAEIPVYSVLATELTGKVSHWRVHGTSHKELFVSEDRWEQMSDVVHLFSFNRGNGYLHGSKGIGREIYSLAGAIDRARNDAVDRLFLSGKYLIQGDEKQLKRFKMHVLGNSVLIGSAYTIADRVMEFDAKSYIEMDQFLRSISDEIVGNISPRFFQGDRVTKAQVDLFASREEEQRDNVVSRFLMQFASFASLLQRKLCDSKTRDTDAKEMQKRLLKIMSREELKILAEQPSASVVQDYSEQERQTVILVATENRGSPLYDQLELERRKVTAQLGEEFANAVLLPANDPTVVAEQSRMQTQEMDLIVRTLQQVPVSPRDNHAVHLEFLKNEIDGEIETLDPSKVPVIAALIQHMRDHLALAVQQGDKSVAAYPAYLEQLETQLAMLQAPPAAVPTGMPEVPGAPVPEPIAPENLNPGML